MKFLYKSAYIFLAAAASILTANLHADENNEDFFLNECPLTDFCPDICHHHENGHHLRPTKTEIILSNTYTLTQVYDFLTQCLGFVINQNKDVHGSLFTAAGDVTFKLQIISFRIIEALEILVKEDTGKNRKEVVRLFDEFFAAFASNVVNPRTQRAVINKGHRYAEKLVQLPAAQTTRVKGSSFWDDVKDVSKSVADVVGEVFETSVSLLGG